MPQKEGAALAIRPPELQPEDGEPDGGAAGSNSSAAGTNSSAGIASISSTAGASGGTATNTADGATSAPSAETINTTTVSAPPVDTLTAGSGEVSLLYSILFLS